MTKLMEAISSVLANRILTNFDCLIVAFLIQEVLNNELYSLNLLVG